MNAQREATHFKNRVLDFVDIYIKTQPTNPLIMQFILPLVDLIQGTGSDEKQLSDKAAGLLKSRFGKAKEVVSNISTENADALLEELHSRARRVHSPDVLQILGGCSMFVSRALLRAGGAAVVIRVYSRTLSDFIMRKASPLNPKFFEELLRRYATSTVQLGLVIIQAASKPANAYRACQAMQLLHVLVSQPEHSVNPFSSQVASTQLRVSGTVYRSADRNAVVL